MNAAAPVLIALSLVTVACSTTGSVYRPAPKGAELEVRDDRDQVWACLLHGQSCASIAEAAGRAPRSAQSMVQAQWTRAIASTAAQSSISRRAIAWLDLLMWARMAVAPGATQTRLRVVAAEALALLAVRDRRAVLDALRRRRAAWLWAITHEAPPHDAFRLYLAAQRLIGDATRSLPGAQIQPLGRARVSRSPVHPRLHTGSRRLRVVPPLRDTVVAQPLPAEPMTYRLGAARPGSYALAFDIPALRTPKVLVMRTRYHGVAWLDGVPARFSAIADWRRDRALVLPASPVKRRLVVALPLPGGGDRAHVGLFAAIREPAARDATWPSALHRSLEALYKPNGQAARRLAARFRHGPLAALHEVHRRASLRDHDERAGVDALDTVLSFFPGHLDARVERAARARDDGDVELAARLMASRTGPALGAETNHSSALLRHRADVGLELARQALGEGLADVAVGLAQQVAAAQRGDCRAMSAVLGIAMDASDKVAIARILADRSRCPAPSLQVADAWMGLGQLKAAAVELSRAVTMAAYADEAGRKLYELSLTANRAGWRRGRLLGDEERLFHKAQVELTRPGSTSAGHQRLDRLVVSGSVRAMEQRRTYFQLGGRPPWKKFVRDGAAVVRRWRAQCASAPAGCDGNGAPITWLLDQEIVVLLPGGGAIRRAHQVIAVHTARAAEALGELQVPVDAELVLARTLDASGAQWLPAVTPDKESVSLRKVVPGAVIEHVQVQFVAADDDAVGATRLSPFLFRSTDGPVQLSELYLLALGNATSPPADSSAAAPRARSEMVQGPAGRRWQSWLWRLRNQPRARPESRAARPEWSMPAVRVRTNASLQLVAERFEEVLAAYLSVDDAALAPWLVKARAAGQAVAPWRALVAEIAGSIAFARAGIDPGSPAAAVRNRKGDRATLLWYLARRAGVDACLVRWQPLTREPSYGSPDPRELSASAIVLYLRPRGAAPRKLWLDPGVDGAILDYLRPGLRGRPALLVGCGGHRAARVARLDKLPDLGASLDRRSIDVSLHWRADGHAVAEVTDRIGGALAALVRNYAAEPKHRATLIKQLARGAFPGWRMTWRGIEVLQGGDKVVLRYAAQRHAPVGSHNELTVGMFPARLGRIYAKLGRRRTSLRFGHALDTTVKLALRNEGAKLVRLPAAVALSHPRASLMRTVTAVGREMTIYSHLRASMGIVEPRAYPVLAKTLRALDDAEQIRLRRVEQP